MPKKTAPYGAWKSPLTPKLIVAETIMLREVTLDEPDVYWLEQRPTEGGQLRQRSWRIVIPPGQ